MLELSQINEILNETPLFAGCAPASLAAIAQAAKVRDYAKGEVIYNAGDQALEMYVLILGLVSFKTKSGEGHLHVETLMKRHMVFGWAALIPEHPRRLGSATCMDASKVLTINGDTIMAILAEHPQSGFVVMKRLCSMIASTFTDKK
ncbi:MAG: cyclic nucleotide-binding domain-containing protein [Hyphomicrobiaceae bacterium]|nr:cyclic nucleotide-binding domain-containing protein [Hyphomicrobiaceae bacterium]